MHGATSVRQSLTSEHTRDKREGFVRAAGVIDHDSKGTRPGKALDPSADARAQRFVRQSRAATPPTPSK